MVIMKNKLRWAVATLMLLGIGLLSSCYPNDDLTNSESDIVMTSYSDTVHFDLIHTYFLPDTIIPMRDKDDTSKVEENPYKTTIINQIVKNMDEYGYQRIENPDSSNLPDVILIASAVSTTNTSVWYPYYPGWDWWYGYPGYGWWGGYYPPYYGGGYITSYTTGTLKINMMNPWKYDVVEGDTIMPVYWDATIHGLLQGSQIDNRIKTNIDQAFKLSPYLKEGK